jgi:RNA polymerase sigma-70 factor (ECF subfamily)
VSADVPYDVLLHRLRRGDDEAWTELVRRHEGEVRRVIRSRLGSTYRPVLDSADIWQSVLASLFVRLSLGQFDLDTPTDLVKLLTRMALNKVASQGRMLEADCRDRRRVAASDSALRRVVAPGPSPSEAVSRCELLQRVRRQLSEEERRLAELHAQGYDWLEIAAAVGGTPNGLRMRLVRAVNRAARSLGLDEVGDA